MSTDSRYSPWRNAMAVPPPNRQPWPDSSARPAPAARGRCGGDVRAQTSRRPPPTLCTSLSSSARSCGVIAAVSRWRQLRSYRSSACLGRQLGIRIQLPRQAAQCGQVGQAQVPGGGCCWARRARLRVGQCSFSPSAAMARWYRPMATEGSPRSMRCRVTRDRPAASAAAVALTRSCLRRARMPAPSAASASACACLRCVLLRPA